MTKQSSLMGKDYPGHLRRAAMANDPAWMARDRDLKMLDAREEYFARKRGEVRSMFDPDPDRNLDLFYELIWVPETDLR